MDLIEKILVRVKDLPTLPTVYSALCDAIADPRSSAADVEKVISTDQASTLKVLKIANSALFGFRGKIHNISRAVVVLGFQEIRNLILSSSVMNLFKKPRASHRFHPRDFWAHSIAVGLITRSLGKRVGVVHLENFFVAGILHDIGKLFLFEFMEKDYSRALAMAEEKNCFIREAELEVLGMDHALVGSMVADEWRLPRPIRDAIHYHHVGMVGVEPDLFVACVHLSDILARALRLGYPGDDFLPGPNDGIWEVLNLGPGMISAMVPMLLKDYEETIHSMLLS
jgi:putative nucleotidyltransferase with HDIG domain